MKVLIFLACVYGFGVYMIMTDYLFFAGSSGVDTAFLDNFEETQDQFLERYQMLEKEPHNFFEDGLGVN